jgi:FkbM family methyltransferase
MSHNIPGHVHAFEPASFLFSFLLEKFKGSKLVRMHKIAMSNLSGEAEFFVVGELAGTNSLTRVDGTTIEKVRTLSLDEFLHTEKIEHVLLVKSDLRGMI